MSSRRVITAIALISALVGGVSAAVYSIPDLGIAPGSSGNALALMVSDGTDQAAININVRYDPTVATPSGVTTSLAGFTARWNVLTGGTMGVPAGLNELRIVLYNATTTTEFGPGSAGIVSVAWDAVGAAGTSTDLEINLLGVSNETGTSVGGTPVSGLLAIVDAPTGSVVTGVGDLSQWTSFGIGFPLNDAGALAPIPGGGGTAGPLTITTDADHDGLGGWGSGATRFNYVADSVYRVDWTLSADANGGTSLNTFRLFVNEDSENAQVEVTVNPPSPGALVADGAARTFSVFFEPSLNDLTPAELADPTTPLGMALVMDVVDFGTNTEAGILAIESVDITRFSTPSVDLAFHQVYDVTDFSDPGVWTLGDDLSIYPANGDFGSFPLDPVTGYQTNAAYVQAGTAGPPTNAGGLGSIGFYQEFGLVPDVVDYSTGAVYRQVVNAITPNASNPDLTATIRMRLFDEALSYSTAYFVRSGPEHSFADPGAAWFAANRPPTEASGQAATYHNYLAYPAGSDQTSLIAGGANSLLAVVALFDLKDTVLGDVRVTDFSIEEAPANVLLP